MLRSDEYAQGLRPGCEVQGRVELECLAVDAGGDCPSERTSNDGADHCCTRFSLPFRRACTEDRDAEHPGVQARACAGGDRASESVRVV